MQQPKGTHQTHDDTGATADAAPKQARRQVQSMPITAKFTAAPTLACPLAKLANILHVAYTNTCNTFWTAQHMTSWGQHKGEQIASQMSCPDEPLIAQTCVFLVDPRGASRSYCQ